MTKEIKLPAGMSICNIVSESSVRCIDVLEISEYLKPRESSKE